jgi:predicted  nucleic acid-binding Zn-ribbon protein
MGRRALLSIAFLLLGGAVFLAGASPALASETEEQLLARLQKEQNPVKKSKEATRLAGIKLDQAVHAYEQGNVEQGEQLVSSFLGRIKDSWQLLKSSGRNAARDPRGFRELDIELREDARRLEDLKHRVSYFDRDPLEKAEKEIEKVRAEVLQALFPAGRAPAAAKPFAGQDVNVQGRP